MHPDLPNLEGRKFTGVTVVSFAGREKSRNLWLCRCNLCGKEIVLRQDVILSDVMKSCGCYRSRGKKLDPRTNLEENTIGPVLLYTEKGEQMRGMLYQNGLMFHKEMLSPEEAQAKRLFVWSDFESTRKALEKLGFHPGKPVRPHRVNLPEDVYQAISQHAKANGQSPTQLIQDIVSAWVARRSKRK